MNHKQTSTFLVLLLLGLLLILAEITPASLAQGRTLIYVDADAGGANSGTSWANAYTHLQDALDQTNANGGTDFEIWVAEGVYTPDDESIGSEHTAGSESEYFTLKYNNVQLYGGFAGNETSRDQRDWTTHPTILSGDIDGNDTNADGNHIAETSADIQGDNADHVLYLDGENFGIIDEATVIDGSAITAGQADDNFSPSDRGGGLYCAGVGGGHECSPSLVNVSFSGNSANESGGGMFDNGNPSGNSSPSLVNVSFSGNSAGVYGGGMLNFGAFGGKSSPSLVNISFNSNSAGSSGGGMYNYGYSGESNPSLVNVSFNGNLAYHGGGGMLNDGYAGNSSPSLVNVSFSGNSAAYGGGMYNAGSSGTSSPSLVNVILWGNTATEDGPQVYNDTATPTFTYSLVEGGISGLGADGGNNLDQDPLFVDAANGDLRLQSGSPAIDAGLTADTFDLDDDGDTTEPIPYDLAGRRRNQGSAVDIGAYEFNLGNTAPTISEGDSVEVAMNVNGSPVAFNLTLHASDPEADSLTWSIAGPAGHGAASVSGTGSSQAISYTSDVDYVGTDSFVVQVSDGALSDTITVTVNITAEEIGQSLYLPLIIK